jgi:predicted RNA binding protein YcfA (HicA-like mRNA interferase family)
MTRRLPALKPRTVIRVLRRAGFVVDHVTGAHHILYHPARPHLRVTVAFHNKDLKPKTVRAIIRQAGLTVDEFLDLL